MGCHLPNIIVIEKINWNFYQIESPQRNQNDCLHISWLYLVGLE